MERDKWQFLIDKQLTDAIGAGKLSNLPGEGKPLQLEDDSHTPAHLRMAHKLLRDNGFAPEWVVMGKELDQRSERLRRSIRQAVRAYKGALYDADRDVAQRERLRQNARDGWLLTVQTLEEVTRKLNKEILSYNLKVPAGITHKTLFNLERELETLLS
ncbi:MAG: DUF1992 domain-containing protein [Anaerolineae bacterium]|nr:DUF1992 domain-containing protein [Anaerolineae bacterium]